MDYRYETKDTARDFHKQRRAFIILNHQVEFLPEGSSMSHFEYCQTRGISREVFNTLTRGYYLNGNLVFYKDNFIYDNSVIEEGLLFVNSIADILGKDEFDIYFGQKPEENFALDYYYGKYQDGVIHKKEKLV